MAGTPNISQNIFSFTSDWDKIVQLQNVPVLDSTLNVLQDVQRSRSSLSLMLALGIAGSRIGEGFRISASPVSNSFTINAGGAVVWGHPVLNRSTIGYSDGAPNYRNRIGEGVISSVPAPNTLVDSSKSWAADDLLDNARVVITSGDDIGSTYVVSTGYGTGLGWWDTTLTFQGATFGAFQPGDTYVVLPPALTTPTAARTDLVYLQVWFDPIDEVEDPALIDEFLQITCINAERLRWCVRVAEGTTIPVDVDSPFTKHYLLLATLNRTVSSAILPNMISIERGLELDTPALSQELIDARTSDWHGTSLSLYSRLAVLEQTTTRNRVFNGSFEIWPNAYGSELPGWIPSSSKWGSAPGFTSSRLSAIASHVGMSSSAQETLTSMPFMVRPGQTLRFSARSASSAASWSSSARLEFLTGTSWYTAPLSTTFTLSFAGTAGAWNTQTMPATVPAGALYARVILTGSLAGGHTLSFDDVAVECAEISSDSYMEPLAFLDIMGNNNFGQDFIGWTLDAPSSPDVSIVVPSATAKYLRIASSASSGSPAVRSWGIDLGRSAINDLMILKVQARYSVTHINSNGGPQAVVRFYSSDGVELTESSQVITNLFDHDWIGVTSGASPAQTTDWNIYCIPVQVPAIAVQAKVELRLYLATGFLEVQSVSLLRDPYVDTGISRTVHDLCSNGDMELGTSGATDDIRFWTFEQGMSGSTAFGILSWYSGEHQFGTRSAKLVPSTTLFPTGENAAAVLLRQRPSRILTEQDRTHGLQLAFYYLRSGSGLSCATTPPRTTYLAFAYIKYMDAAGAYVGAHDPGFIPADQYTAMLDLTANTPVVDDLPTWVPRVLSSVPPADAVRVEIGFGLYGNSTDDVFLLDGVRLWSRTYNNSDILFTEAEVDALQANASNPLNISDDPATASAGTQAGARARADHVHYHGALDSCGLDGNGDPDENLLLHAIAEGGVKPGYVSKEQAQILEDLEIDTLGSCGVLDWTTTGIAGVSLLAAWGFGSAIPTTASLRLSLSGLGKTLEVVDQDPAITINGDGYYVFKVLGAPDALEPGTPTEPPSAAYIDITYPLHGQELVLDFAALQSCVRAYDYGLGGKETWLDPLFHCTMAWDYETEVEVYHAWNNNGFASIEFDTALTVGVHSITVSAYLDDALLATTTHSFTLVAPPDDQPQSATILVKVIRSELPACFVPVTESFTVTESATQITRHMGMYVPWWALWPTDLTNRPKNSLFLDSRYLVRGIEEIVEGDLADAAVTSDKLASSILFPADRAVGPYHIQNDSICGGHMLQSGVLGIAGAGLRWYAGVGLQPKLTVDCDEVTLTSCDDGVECALKVRESGISEDQLAHDSVTFTKIAEGAVQSDARRYFAFHCTAAVADVATGRELAENSPLILGIFAINIGTGQTVSLAVARCYMDKDIDPVLYLADESETELDRFTWSNITTNKARYKACTVADLTFTSGSDQVIYLVMAVLNPDVGAGVTLRHYDSIEVALDRA